MRPAPTSSSVSAAQSRRWPPTTKLWTAPRTSPNAACSSAAGPRSRTRGNSCRISTAISSGAWLGEGGGDLVHELGGFLEDLIGRRERHQVHDVDAEVGLRLDRLGGLTQEGLADEQEGVDRSAFFLAEAGQGIDPLAHRAFGVGGQLVARGRDRPAVTPAGGAPQGGVAVAADDDGDRVAGLWRLGSEARLTVRVEAALVGHGALLPCLSHQGHVLVE